MELHFLFLTLFCVRAVAHFRSMTRGERGVGSQQRREGTGLVYILSRTDGVIYRAPGIVMGSLN